MKVIRLEWAGLLLRMGDNRTVKKVFLRKTVGNRKAERPKLRWLEYTENDLIIEGCQEIEEESENRSI
jgi:hypothetical protein